MNWLLKTGLTDPIVPPIQDKLVETTNAISVPLEYFQELEHATRMLNHPGEALVLQTDFLSMVERVDVCIEYFQSHVCSRFAIQAQHAP
jgi:hypothetical protein